ncbi:MAG: PAS domain-containing protein [bacterium]
MPKTPFKKHVTVSIWIPLFLALNLYCYFKFQNDRKNVLTDISQRVVSQRDLLIANLSERLNAQFELAGFLSHSLSLRRKIIKHNQVLLEKIDKNRTELIESEINSLWNNGKDSDEKSNISTSLEAVFLRDFIKATNSVVDRVFVTDAFGFVRVSSHPPENINCFFDDWWQRALMVKVDHFYRYYELDGDQSLYLACPLYNDEGLDPVGVINLRINLETLFIGFENFQENLSVRTTVFTDQNYTWESSPARASDSLPKPPTLSTSFSPYVIDKDLQLIMSASFYPDRYFPISPALSWSVMASESLPNFYSYKSPAFRTFLITWIFLVIISFILSWGISSWISNPIISFMAGILSIVKKREGVTKADDPIVLDPSDILDRLHRTIEDTAAHKEKQLRESTTSIKAISEYIKTAALEFDRKLIAESLLNISAEKFHADAGILFIQNAEYHSPMILFNKLTPDKLALYTSLKLHDYDSKRLYFSWHHHQHQAIWDDGFQVLISVPIQTKQMHFGTLYLFFKQAIELDIENDQTLDLLAQQCAVYSSRSSFFYKLEREVSFIEGILSGVPWFICTIDRNMRITWHNNNSDIPFNRPVEQLAGTYCYSSFKNRNTPCPNCPVKRTFQEGLPNELSQTWNLATNEVRQIKLNTYPFKEENVEKLSTILFIRDITTEIETQSEIRRLSMAIDNMGEAVIITDMDGKIIFINKAFTRIFDYSAKDMVGRHLELIFAGKESGIFKKIVAAINHDKIWTCEKNLLHRNEKRIPTSMTATPALDEIGTPIGLIITCFDLTTHVIREKQIIENYKELEILHKINKTLGWTTNLEDLLQSVLMHVATFTGCDSGAVILYQKQESTEPFSNGIITDPNKPYISNEIELPGYFSNYIDEYRDGRKSALLDSFQLSNNPTILDNLRSQDSIESKLITRMGFKSVLAIPFQAHNYPLGLILLFSKNSYHFSKDNFQIYQSISALTGIEVYGRYLQEKLLAETRQSTEEKIVNRIGTDIQEVLGTFNISDLPAENALRSQSWPNFQKSIAIINWKHWILNQIAQNLLAYDSNDDKLFFPEDINSLVADWLKQVENSSYLENISYSFKACEDLEEVYIHKVSIRHAFINLLIFAIDSCRHKPHSIISVNIRNSYDYYAIEIKHDGPVNEKLMEQIYKSNENAIRTIDMPVLLSSTIRILENHKALLTTAQTDAGETVFRMVLPRYPKII